MSSRSGLDQYEKLVAARNADLAAAGRHMAATRRVWEKHAARFPSAADVCITTVDDGQVQGECSVTPGADAAATLLYLHGGAYCFGSPSTHRRLYSELGRAAGCRVFAANYRLAPEHPFPAALDDVCAAWEWLCQQQTGPLAVAGDSAGAGLTLALMLRLRDEGRLLPAAAFLIAPWVDLHMRGKPSATEDSSLGPSPQALRQAAHAYAGENPRDHPWISPLFGKLRGLPPTLIQVSASESLCDDALRLTAALAHESVAVQLDVWPDQPHVWQAYWPMLETAKPAIDFAGSWLHGHLRD